MTPHSSFVIRHSSFVIRHSALRSRFRVLTWLGLALLPWFGRVHAASFGESFEGYAQGDLDKNLANGNNAAPNGSGNPWWGANPPSLAPNFAVVGSENGVDPHSGLQMLRNEVGSLFRVGTYDNDREYYNLAFRQNGGTLYYGNLALEWWFYDPCGDSATDPWNRDYYDEFAGLANFGTGIPGDADYSGSGDDPASPVQRLMLGAFNALGAADTSKYQAIVLGATNGLSGAYPAYFNTATTRSVGWHHARIVLGTPNPRTHTAMVKFYLDDMLNPALTHDNAGGTGINCIQVCSLVDIGSPSPMGGYLDDFYFQDGVTAPAIAAGLTNLAVAPGDTVTLAVGGVTGTPAPALYWQKDGSALTNDSHISGADTTALIISNITPADFGAYSLLASNVAGCALTSAVVGLPVPPTLDSQSPTGGTVVASLGATVTFSVSAHATHPIGYQWSKDGSPLSNTLNLAGATAPTLTLRTLAANNAGSYSCTLSNLDGATNSIPVLLQLSAVPVILSQPASLVIGAGTNASFTVAAACPSLVYRWSKDGTPLSNGARTSGAASASLTIAGALDADAGAYTCFITNTAGFTNTAPASLQVVDPPLITLQPQPASQVTYPGSNLVFQVAAQGTPPLGYQWLRSGVPLLDSTNVSGSTTPTLNLTVASTEDEGLYQCSVSNFANVALSAGAVVRVRQAEVAFFDDFESYLSCCLPGGPGTSGWRGGAQLDGQGPWWGWSSPNIRVYTAQNGITPHTGSQMIGGPFNGAIGTSDDDRTYLNISYRFNNGALYFGNILLDWYFCDLFPTNNASYSDQVSLANYGQHVPPDSDTDLSKPTNLVQRLAIGGWPGGDLARYQCAVMTAPDGLSGDNGELGGVCNYFNTTAARTNGWHHARILVGPADAATRVATCSFYIDDMLEPVLIHDNAGGPGFNAIDIASDIIYSGGDGQTAAGYFDDLAFRAVNDPFILEQPVDQAAPSGESATLAVAAFGAGFQWQKDGAPLQGATNAQLTLNPALTTDAGGYACVVTGANGSITSSIASLSIISNAAPPLLAVARAGHAVVITWAGPSVLQSATNAAGPYLDVTGATSPYTNSLPATRVRFFRLRTSAGARPTLAIARARSGVVITWAGPYTLQSSTSAPGPYLDVAGASSPYTNALPAVRSRFFRLRN